MKKKFKVIIVIWIILTMVLLIMAINIERKKSKEDFFYTGMSYEVMLRKPDIYKGEAVKFTGSVTQVMESRYSTAIMLYIYDSIDDNYNVLYCDVPNKLTKNNRILVGDELTIYGIFKKLYTYEGVDENEDRKSVV